MAAPAACGNMRKPRKMRDPGRVLQSIQEAVLGDPLRISLGICFATSGLIFSKKASRDFNYSNLGIKRRHSPTGLSHAGEARCTQDSLGGVSSDGVPSRNENGRLLRAGER